jgi:hypothetical protein
MKRMKARIKNNRMKMNNGRISASLNLESLKYSGLGNSKTMEKDRVMRISIQMLQSKKRNSHSLSNLQANR